MVRRPRHNPCRTAPQLPALALALAGLVLGGCASYKSDTAAIRSAWVAGDNATAANIASGAAENRKESVDYVVFGLESGAALRAAGRFEDSNRQFAAVEAKMSEYAAGADVRLAAEAGATLTNLSFLPYVGTPYDKVMLSTYATLNDLQLGNFESARVNLNRALEYQRDAVRDNAKELEAATRAANEADTGKSGALDVARTRDNPEFNSRVLAAYDDMSALRAYADYVNPFAVLLDGLFFLYQGDDGSDLERARKSLERVRAMADETGYVAQDMAAIEALIRGERQEPVTYVIFETGMSASRDQIRIDLPLFIFGVHKVPYVGAAFPKLVTHEDFIPHLHINASAKGYRTERICRMDSVIARDFDNELNVIITKTLLSAGIKAAATYGLAEAGRQIGGDDVGKLIGNLILIAGTAYQAMMNEADLRSWITLPKYFDYARLPTPADHRLTLTPQGSGSSVVVDLEPALVNVVYVKSNSARAPLNVFQFPLKPLPSNP